MQGRATLCQAVPGCDQAHCTLHCTLDPVENQIAELPDVEMRVEQGRNEKNRLIDDTRDPKYQLTEAIESLYEQPPSIAALRAGLQARPVSPILPPPKRTSKQGEI